MEENWEQYRDKPTSEDWSQYKDPTTTQSAPVQGSGNSPQSGMMGVLQNNAAAQNVMHQFGQGIKTLGSDLIEAPKAMYQMGWKALHQSPVATVQDLMQPNIDQQKKAVAAFGRGNDIEGYARNAASKVPVAGPAVANAVDEVRAGKVGEGIAHGVEMIAPELMKRLPAGLPWTRKVKNLNNPVEEAAIDYVENKQPFGSANGAQMPGVRMTPGQRSGDVRLQRNERNLVNEPGTANEAQDFYRGQQEDLAKRGSMETMGQGGRVTNPTEAARSIFSHDTSTGVSGGKLVDVLNSQKREADSLYAQIRSDASANKQQVQTGTKTSKILNASGNPIQTPIMDTLESPMALDQLRTRLAPIYEDLTRQMPDALKQQSPAFASLRNIMETSEQYMNAMDFDKTLGALKAIARDGKSPFLSDRSQGLAKQLIAAGEAEFQQALGPASPGILQKLSEARMKVKDYHATDDLIRSLPKEPGALYHQLTKGNDLVVEKLAAIKNLAPDEIQTLGRTYLEELMNKATQEGGFGKAVSIDNDWHKLKKETRDLLFEQGVPEDLDKFFLGAKRLSQAVATGSPTADRLMAISSYGDIGMALLEFVGATAMGHPGAGAAGAGMMLAKTRAYPAYLARLSFRPQGASLLADTMTLPINSPKFNQAMRALETMAEAERTKTEKPEAIPGVTASLEAQPRPQPPPIPQPFQFGQTPQKPTSTLPPWMTRPPLAPGEQMQPPAQRWLPGQQ